MTCKVLKYLLVHQQTTVCASGTIQCAQLVLQSGVKAISLYNQNYVPQFAAGGTYSDCRTAAQHRRYMHSMT